MSNFEYVGSKHFADISQFAQHTFGGGDVTFSYFSWFALVFVGVCCLFGIARSRKRNHGEMY